MVKRALKDLLFLAFCVGLYARRTNALPTTSPGSVDELIFINSTNATDTNLNTVIDLGYAKYQGHINPTTRNTEFLGLRFARAPVGRGVLANALPKRCIGTSSPGAGDQSPFFPSLKRGEGVFDGNGRQGEVEKRSVIDPPGMSEDCLFLNVYAPGNLNATSVKRKSPVVVWIHGGGYSRGSASGISNSDFFDGNDLISESPLDEPVVVVVIQYRLGLFGFLAGAEVGKRGVLNVGSLDQQFALKWVHEHIHLFGGDPEHVVVWGQSAGAGSSIQHMLGNGGNTQPKLLKTIISSSSFLPSQYAYDDPIPEGLFSLVVEHAACTTASDMLSCLRAAPVDLLTQINDDMTRTGFFGTFTFVPVVDGQFIRERLSQLLRAGNFNGVDMVMANTNSFEGIHFVNPANPLPLDAYVKSLFPLLENAEVQQAVELYAPIRKDPGGNESLTMTNQAVAVHGEAILICPTYWLLQAFDGKSYKSEFAVPPGDHITDVPYYWPSQGDGPAFKDPGFDAAFSHSFLNFATTLDPTGSGTPTWNRWSRGNGGMVEMLFNKTDAGQPVIRTVQTDDGLLKRCRFWESVGHLTGQ